MDLIKAKKNSSLILQIAYHGISETAKLRRTGFAFHFEYDAFLSRYKVINCYLI